MKQVLNGKFKFVVVGGGTAGWIAALYVKRYFTDTQVTVIESSEMGVIGVGESTTPHIINMLGELNIDIGEFIKNTQSTIKNSIKFTNWHGDNKHYYHSFAQQSNVDWHSSNLPNCIPPMGTLEHIISDKTDSLLKIDFTALACEQNKVRFSFKQPNEINNTSTAMQHFNVHGAYAIHIDAILMSRFLKQIGISRGIKVIDGIVEKINNNNKGNIESFELKNVKKPVPCNFVFDCTGLNRLIIGKHFKTEWRSYKEYLPVNGAISFTQYMDPNKDIPPYTECIAMKYGWMWKIPLQHRYGCGYVFDKNYINSEEAIKEVEDLLKSKINVDKRFSFEAGAHETIWVKNCIAVGLANGFIEPLESTSIMNSIQILNTFLQHINGLIENDKREIDLFNTTTNDIANAILTFVCFHYHTKRADTDFWKKITKNYKTLGLLEKLINNNKDISYVHNNYLRNEKLSIFPPYSWDQVGIGLKFYDKEKAAKLFDAYNLGKRKTDYENLKTNLKNRLGQILPNIVSHRMFLNYILSR